MNVICDECGFSRVLKLEYLAFAHGLPARVSPAEDEHAVVRLSRRAVQSEEVHRQKTC